ncbi:MAG TPA: twin-arginine translocase TatA/TatE family subunit [Mucilaginibacter sp.]|jgi:sec-independent protein translocase protein TatA|nr:twin-arginine translocase TatA/TatE family subunit [Mucilaginibacter sp.]
MHSGVLLFLSGPDLMLIMFIALLLFGGEKLPEIARGLGKGIRDFKDASEGVKREINNQINNYEEKKAEEAAAKAQAALPPAQEQVTLPTAEHTEIVTNEHEAHAPEPGTVPNTMPYVESHNPVAETHLNGTHTESPDVKGDKEEPVKTES